MAAISDLKIWSPLLVLAVLYALIFGGFKGRAFLFAVAFTLVLSDSFVVKPLKNSIGRLRPKQTEAVRMVQLQKARPRFLTLIKTPAIRRAGVEDRENSGSSFPSGHVADNFAIAVCGAFFFRPWGAFYFLVAGAIGYSRIYLGAHWPSDVLATAFMAVGETLLILAALESLWRWAAPRWWPALFARHPHLIAPL